MVRLEEIGFGTKTLERVGVTPIIKNMVETRIRWFGHGERRLVDYIVRRVQQIDGSQTARGRGRPRKLLRKTLKNY